MFIKQHDELEEGTWIEYYPAKSVVSGEDVILGYVLDKAFAITPGEPIYCLLLNEHNELVFVYYSFLLAGFRQSHLSLPDEWKTATSVEKNSTP